jgi:hypothetical protein
MIRNLSLGTHCKACDAILNPKHHDPELCPTCLEVVTGMTEDLFHDNYIDEIISTLEVSKQGVE